MTKVLAPVGRPCPECGGTLTYEPRGRWVVPMFYPTNGAVVDKAVAMPFLSCNGCELIGTLDGTLYGLPLSS